MPHKSGAFRVLGEFEATSPILPEIRHGFAGATREIVKLMIAVRKPMGSLSGCCGEALGQKGLREFGFC